MDAKFMFRIFFIFITLIIKGALCTGCEISKQTSYFSFVYL